MNSDIYSTKKFWTKKKIIILIMLIVILCLSVCGLLYYFSPAQRISRAFSKAEEFIFLKGYSSAIDQLDTVLEIDKENVDAYLMKAEALVNLSKESKAIKLLETGYKNTSNENIKEQLDILLIEQAIELGNKFLSSEKYQNALEEFETASEKGSKSIEVFLGKADAYNGLNDLERAIECINDGIKLYDDERLTSRLTELKYLQHIKKGDELLLSNDFDAALNEFYSSLDIKDNDPQIYLKIASAYNAMDKEDMALEVLNKGLEKTDDEGIKNTIDNIMILDLMTGANRYLSEHNYLAAKEEYQKILDLDNTNIEAYLGYGNACMTLNHLDDAIEVLSSGAELTDNEQVKEKLNQVNVRKHVQQGNALFAQKKYEEAKSEYESALAIDKGCEEAYLGIGNVYVSLGKSNEAVKILETGYEVTGDDDIEDKIIDIKRTSYLNSALKYYNNGDYQSAAKEYNNAVSVDPLCVDAYMGLANSYLSLGNDEKALEALSEGYNKTNNYNLLRKYTDLKLNPVLALAKQYYSNKNYSAAAEKFSNAIDIDPSCVDAYLGLSDSYAMLKKYDKAKEALNKGYNATGSSTILNRINQSLLNFISLSPQKTTYEPLNQLVEQILSQITNDSMTTYEKVKACYDYLINNAQYGNVPNSYYNFEGSNIEYKYAERAAYAILVEKKGICTNYSCAFAALTRALGLEMKLRRGETTQPGGGYGPHTWCELNIDGVIYVFDPQAEDTIMSSNGGRNYYYRFCKQYANIGDKYIPKSYYTMFIN